jgi:adenylate cyclase
MYKKLKILIPLILLTGFALIQFFSLIPALDNVVYDNLMLSEREADENIIIVGIDERSINEIGRWPWPRYFVADTISKLSENGAAAIGVNVLYDVYGLSEEYDKRLIQSAEQTDRLVLAASGYFSLSSYEMEAEDYLVPFEELAEVTEYGFVNILPDEADGVVRNALTEFKYGDITVHSLPYEVYKTYMNSMGKEPIDIPLDEKGSFPINYAARPGAPSGYRVVSLWGVINDEYNPEIFRDAIVLIGPYAEGIGTDNFPTPLDRRTPTYGVEINANIIQTILEGDFKEHAAWHLNLVFLLVPALIAIILFYKLKPISAAVVMLVLAGAEIAAAMLAYMSFDVIVKSGDVIVFLIICYISNLVLSILSTQNEKAYIQGLFGRYVAPEVVDQILAGGVKIELGGIEKDITVLFVDIRGFTAFSEANPPEKVVAMVNRYLGLTSKSVTDNGGTIDKYIGDATMAVFNAPNDLPEHALCACKAAWAMKEGSAVLQQEILEEYGVDLQFGVGLNTGTAVVGNMGSALRMDYTAIGDTVNTAARLEANSQKGQIIISDATYQLVKDYVYVTDLGELFVKNKKLGIQIYNLDGIKGE